MGFSLPDVEEDVIHYVGECGSNGNELCRICQGNCDSDNECQTGLVCSQCGGFDEGRGCTGHGGNT